MTFELEPWQQRILDTEPLTYVGILRGGRQRLAGSAWGRGGHLYCPSPVEPDAIIDPPRPQPVTGRDGTWVLRFGKQQVEYEIADSPTGRGLATYVVGPLSTVVGFDGSRLMAQEPDDDRQWCSIHGYDIPTEHVCVVAVCYNPTRDGQELKGTLAERFAAARETIIALRSW